jgi:dihydrofolate synthase/folylpolyglutamate synthase
MVSEEELAGWHAAARYVNGLIRGSAGPARQRTPTEQRQVGPERIARMRRFLEALQNPHDDLPVVLVAGTSGKGSVAVKIAAGLREAGYHTGLHVTPYLQTPLEKFWLDGQLARPSELTDLIAWIRPTVERLTQADPAQPPTYGMVWVALTFEYFRRAGVDALVLEVGAGGRFDLTNVGMPLLSVITTVGLDHEKSLGPSLADIAWHKAGVMRPGVPTVISDMPAAARAIVTNEARRIRASVATVTPMRDGDFRAANDAISAAALRALAGRGFHRIDESAVEVSRTASLPGRYEVMPPANGARVVLDGAHNPDKAAALADLRRREVGADPMVLVLGTVGYRSPKEILGPLLPLASAWVATEPQVFGKPPTPAGVTARAGRDLGFPAVAEMPEPAAALDLAFDLHPPDGHVLVAGSLYLAGNLRSRWYPTLDVERQRTMWPLRDTECADG